MTDLFADAHAILAFLAGDETTARKFRTANLTTGILNVYESHYAQLKAEVSTDEAKANLAPFEPKALVPDVALLREAARVRVEEFRRGRPLSFIDAVGYAQARKLDAAFLTTQVVFKGMAGVELLSSTTNRRSS